LLALSAWTWVTSPVDRHSGWPLATALAPAVWTAVLIYRFCRERLNDGHRAAVVRVAAHQAIVWTAFVVIGGAAVGLWPRVVGIVLRTSPW
jgi:hypothetical protein